MDKELKVYKNGLGAYDLIGYKDISGRHRLMVFDPMPDDIQVDDALWAIKDKEKQDARSIMIVHEIREDGIICRDVDHGFIKDLRKFEEGEEFTIVATFRTII